MKEIEDAVREVLKSKNRNFVESVDLCINLRDIDMSNPSNRISEDILLPFGMGKRICVFAEGEVAMNAREHADLVVSSDEISKIDKKTASKLAKEYDFFIADTSLMPMIGKGLGPILGPRGKMPSPTVAEGVEEAIRKLRNTVRIQSKDKMSFHVKVGSKDMKIDEIVENIRTIINRIETIVEMRNIRSIHVKTTMGSPINVI
jgi:large subunit ribosomal protein L1